MYRIAMVAVAVVLLGMLAERTLVVENGAPGDKSAAAKSDREKIDVKPPAALQDRQDVKHDVKQVAKPAPPKADRERADREKGVSEKADREDKKPAIAKTQPAPVQPPAAAPKREAEKSPPAKGDHAQEKPPAAAVAPGPVQPAGAPKQEAEKPPNVETQPPVKVEREKKTPPVASVTPASVEHPAAKPQRESKRHARPARHALKPRRRAYADVRHNAVRGNDAQVMRARKAWLRALAHKYGYNEW